MNNNLPDAISKELSANDTGDTGGHQAGMLIPRDPAILAFFPTLAADTKNPREILTFTDADGEEWQFAYIYYNNRFFGGTRNEYRLTRMTSFIRTHSLKPGDTVTLRRTGNNKYSISCERIIPEKISTEGILKLGSGWRVVKI